MKFIDTIVEHDNRLILELANCKKNGYETYILGDGEIADNIEKIINDFEFAGRLVNKVRYNEKKDRVYCLEDFLDDAHEKINIIVGYNGFKKESLAKWSDKIAILIDKDPFFALYHCDPKPITYSFVKEHEKEIEQIYYELEDEKSRETLSAYLNQKISSDYKYLKELKSYPQYYESDVISLTDNETFVDCGAYDGDSAESFINELTKRGIEKYRKIISFEPDPVNFKKLEERHFPNHTCINKGTSDKNDSIQFSVSGTNSGSSTEGNINIMVDTLDKMIQEEVSFIKMDIEGMELSSLIGAESIIKKYHPKLAICIYHKKRDIWEIQNYLKAIVPEYKFYIRAYSDFSTELVLYAIL